MVICRDSTQKDKATRLSKIEDKEVHMLVQGVISGIPTSMSVEQIKDNVKVAKVKEAKPVKTTRNGEKCDSWSVMLIFDKERVPSKVYIGYMCVMR